MTRTSRPQQTRPTPAVPTRITRMTYWKRRAGVVLSVLGIALLLVLGSGYGGAEADLVRPEVAGHATVEPGQTLWDVAVDHAPDDVDPRTYLARIQEINGLDGSAVPAWTVVLLPAD